MTAIVQMSRIDVEKFFLQNCGDNGWQWVREDGKAILSLGGCGSSPNSASEAQAAIRQMYKSRVRLF